MIVYLIFVLGFAALLMGGEWLVRGAAGIAVRLAIPPLVIGLTIVAFGTSAPELIVSLKSALDGASGLAIGNVVGSNIANVLLVLGVAALFSPILCTEKGIRANVFILVALSVGFTILMLDGNISRFDGVLLLVVLFLFLAFQFSQSRGKNSPPPLVDDIPDHADSLPLSLFFIVLGLVVLPVAAHFTVEAAREIALQWGVPDDVIGLTVVAIGTSLPELATGISAARQKNTSVLVGSIVGSNIFNIAAIMGITAVVVPIPVSEHIMDFDIWMMLAVTGFLATVALMCWPIGRKLGVAMSLVYIAYLGFTVAF